MGTGPTHPPNPRPQPRPASPEDPKPTSPPTLVDIDWTREVRCTRVVSWGARICALPLRSVDGQLAHDTKLNVGHDAEYDPRILAVAWEDRPAAAAILGRI